jgi:ribosomal protein L24
MGRAGKVPKVRQSALFLKVEGGKKKKKRGTEGVTNPRLCSILSGISTKDFRFHYYNIKYSCKS